MSGAGETLSSPVEAALGGIIQNTRQKNNVTLNINFIWVSYFTSNLSAPFFVPPLHIAFLQVRLLARIQSIHPSPSITGQYTSIHGRNQAFKDDHSRRLYNHWQSYGTTTKRDRHSRSRPMLMLRWIQDELLYFNNRQSNTLDLYCLLDPTAATISTLATGKEISTGRTFNSPCSFARSIYNLFQKWPRKPRVPSVRPSTTLSLVNTPFTCTSTSTAGKYLSADFPFRLSGSQPWHPIPVSYGVL